MLIHSSELARHDCLPQYEAYLGIRLSDYKAGRAQLRALASQYQELLQARRSLRELDHEGFVDCEQIELPVPRSLWFKTLTLPLPASNFEQARASSNDGPCELGVLRVRSGWRTRTACVRYQCPSRVLHRERIDALAQKLAGITPEQRAALQELDNSPWRSPLLFISHRWESTDHPDPGGKLLSRLREIGDAFLIIDYCSFPQKPYDALNAKKMDLILMHMDKLLRNVLVMQHPEYLTRGWCVYEYLAACLSGHIACDEIGDTRFRTLLQSVLTRAPTAFNEFHDGAEAGMLNYLQESKLHAVNGLLPVFKAARYTQAEDEVIVRRLLLDMLKSGLPAKRNHNPYLGESTTQPWRDEELEVAFDRNLQWEPLDSQHCDLANVQMSATLSDAIQRDFRIEVQDPNEMLDRMAQAVNPWAVLYRSLSEGLREDDYLRFEPGS